MKSNKYNIGILAFGSLISDPGTEIGPLIHKKVTIDTPFSVEFAKCSKTRGGAATLVPISRNGSSVKAKILILKNVSLPQAKDMLWRRETRNKNPNLVYSARKTKRAVRIKELKRFGGVDTVIYVDFYAVNKLREPKPKTLASRAIKSVGEANLGMDGISYLMSSFRVGIKTPLMKEYKKEILKMTKTLTLNEALQKVRSQKN